MTQNSYLSPIYFLYNHRLLLLLSFIISNCFHINSKQNLDLSINRKIEQSYFANGQLEYEAEFYNGKLDGVIRVWNEDGILKSKSEYSNGKAHGIWKQYHVNGKISYSTTYQYGEKNGSEKWFYKNGALKSEQEFNNGMAISKIARFTDNGQLIY